ncbi:MAG: valine--tRNA ligase [Oscillospiraceae bacterium]
MRKELEKNYDPSQFEDRIYKFWLDGGYFKGKKDPNKTPYTIVIPPPNITGQLHMGHALDETLQDILIRYRRLQGYAALWIPGTDHASIATEAKIVEAMKKEGLTKDDLGRDGFLERAWEWKKTYGGRIIEQLKKLGTSCDWSRERFTLDDGCSKAVQEVFIKLYNKGLIYRGERIINWCPHCKTSISEAEVEYEEQQGHFWHLRYPLSDGSGYMELATTRPETLLGDTAIAVNPADERYKAHIGKMVILPLVNREIPIVADDYVDVEFGTGVVKITPAHDPNDFEVGLRHNLPIINVMTEDAHINEKGLSYQGLDRYEARKRIVEDLDKGGFLVKTEPHDHNVGACYRCHTTVEPRVSMQWFVKMEPLAKPAIDAVRNGETKFIPERFDKVYYHWMENIKDWCISRQLWWGHRIPAYYCADCGEVTISREQPESCSKCGSHSLKQDEDTLDTWFSSALWPFSTLGWPDNTEDLDYFYPTNTLVTGYDIIFFWVARMIFSALEQTQKVPFDTVFIHGLVRDAQGRKMSKSLGNGIDPLEAVEKYGADALRLALVTGSSPGNDMRFSEEKITAARNFANKLWNATRFIMMNISDEISIIELPDELQIEDKWVLSRYNTLVRDVTDNLDKFELGIAVQKLYDFIWDILCDWYIELTKSRLQAGGDTSLNAQKVLLYIMTGAIKLLHPFMPFITEEIFQALPNDSETIMTASFPVYKEELNFEADEIEFARIMDAIKGIRNVRTEMNVPPSKKAAVYIETEFVDTFNSSKAFFERLASASEVNVAAAQNIEGAVQIATTSARIFLPLDELIDKEKELERLTREKATCQKDIDMLSGKISNENFVSKAPAKVVDEIKMKLAKANELMQKIDESLSAL